MKKKYLIWSIIIVAIIVVLAFSGIFKKQDDSVGVTLLELEKVDIVETVSATGKVQPEIEVKLTSEVSGEIIDLPIKEGQVVQKGDLLVKINPDIYESSVDRMTALLSTSLAGLAQVEAQLTEAEANFNRNKTLFEKGVISGSEWDKITSSYQSALAGQKSAYFNVESAKAGLTEAQKNLLRTTIYAPSYGTISRVDVELGERVLGTQQMAGTEILRIANLSRMEVEVDINENDIVKVKEKDLALINVDAYLKKEFKGQVTSISNSASNTTLSADQVTTFKVKIQILPESYEDLIDHSIENYSPFRPGMTAAVDIITQEKKDVFSVPISAVVMRSPTDTLSDQSKANIKTIDKQVAREAVFINDNGIAKIRFITTGIQDDKNIEILKGLSQGEQIITGPYSIISRTLKNSDKVKEQE